ncbi:hypothetical protein [Nostoc sp. NMS9]|uniref:hypothetical protein n=1 Tax=Nostoc sp. NMS9 TaxID=2815393 RepID=UPI0025E026D2|nr:hypothetical protein [Nostoc sp. NMS9]
MGVCICRIFFLNWYNFGYNTVPSQRRRILQGRSLRELPFARIARYGEDYPDKLPLSMTRKQVEPFNLQTFLRSSDRDVVSLLLASMLTLIVLFTLLTTFGYSQNLVGTS